MDEKLMGELVFIIMLLIHVVADFYFQTDNLAQKKIEEFKAVLIHVAIYCLSAFVGMAVSVKMSFAMVITALLLGSAHAFIDIVKFCYIQRIKDDPQKQMSVIFYVDQILHLCSIILIWFYCRKEITPYAYTAMKPDYLYYYPITMLLCVLLLLKPASLFITNSGFLMHASESDSQHTGEKIGYLERLIIFSCIMCGDISAIGFVITAKSIARFPELNSSTAKKSEYYIIGTLMSIVAAFIITFSFGLYVIPT